MRIKNIAVISLALVLCLQPFVADAVSTFMRARQEEPVIDTDTTGVTDDTTVAVDNATTNATEVKCFDPNTWTADPNISQILEGYGQNLSTDVVQLRVETETTAERLNDNETWFDSPNNTDFISLQNYYWALFKLVRTNLSQEVQINEAEINLHDLQCVQTFESNETLFNSLNDTEKQCARSFDPTLPWIWNFTVAAYKNDSATAVYYLLETLQFWPEIQRDCYLGDDDDDGDNDDDDLDDLNDNDLVDTVDFESEDYSAAQCATNLKNLANSFTSFAHGDTPFDYQFRDDFAELYFDTIGHCIGTEDPNDDDD